MSNKILTIMFADVSGSSRLFKTVGDTRAREVVSLAVTMMMDKTLENHGTVIKTIGDEVMAAFDSVDAAVHAAISIQNTISARTAEIPLSIRIGVHEGSVIEEDADIFGEAVNDAAAIVKEAKGGQILISGSSIKKLSQGLASNSCVFDDIRLKGDDHKQAIHLILWQDDEADSDITVFEPGITPEMVQRFSTSEALTLSYMGRDIVIGKDQTPFSIGRARGSDLRIKSRSASREHCTIDYHRGKFVLLEKSTNGTQIFPNGGNKLYVRREEIPLTDSGLICFSMEDMPAAEDTLEYSC